MIKQIEMVTEFHKRYGVRVATEPDICDESDEYKALVNLRKRLMIEEVKEWAEAAEYNYNRTERAKELADILYVVFGTVITEGFQEVIEEVFQRVHNSNMSKGNNGEPFIRADGKILKGTDYVAPNVDFVIDYYDKKAGDCSKSD